MISFTLEKEKISVYPALIPHAPVICIHTFGDDGDQIYRLLQNMDCPDFSLVAVSGLHWEHDMAPWDCPPVTESGSPFTGGANDQLKLLTGEILPAAEQHIPGPVLWRGIAGYSLAGLFAVYSLWHTDLFSRAASISGSLWFPGFREYILSHEMAGKPQHLYFSLGDREHRTRNPSMKSVRRNTEEIQAFFRRKGIDTAFRLNPGNHFQDAAERTAAGIAWLLDR